jgi:hypothetical protein
MEIILPVALLAFVLSAVSLWAWRRQLRQEPQRDDTMRAGDDAALSPEEAAQRAGDRNSWMIPSGF